MLYSFVTFMALLPSILPTWQEKPLPKGHLIYDLEGYKSEQEATLKQNQALEVGDPIFRLSVLWKLSTLKNEDASTVMYNYLSKENDPLMKTATLRYLYESQVLENKMAYVEKLVNGQTDEGIAAARLYCRFKEADLQKVIKILSNVALKDQITLTKALAATERLSSEQWISIYGNSKAYSFRQAPLTRLSKIADAKAVGFLTTVMKTGNNAEKAVISKNLIVNDKTKSLIDMALNSKHATVRAAGARALKTFPQPAFLTKLVQLSQDSDTDVRKAAIESLSKYTNEKSTKALFLSLKDNELLNQKLAVDSLLKISKNFDISTIIEKGIAQNAIGTRRWSAHLLGKLVKSKNAKAIAQQLKKESDFDARTEQVYALGQFKHELSSKSIDKLSKDHERVRAALMHYLGKIDKEVYFKYIHEAAMKDSVNTVRWAALEAAGNNGSPWFNKTLIDIMNDLDKENMRDYQDRACACWAAGKIRGLDKKMIDVMILFMNRPTIPVVMGPNTYDNSQVLIAIQFAFADQYHRGGEKKDYFYKYAKSFHFRFLKDRRSVDFPRNYHNDNYADQGWAYLVGEKAPKVELPE
ncbi:MAG: HEAT repeat domain-containing protein, partial [Lentisphaeraceae bacterium]|nr:HEAT repeat domain-containing protein [Lentisphaeraceae bacterium]